MLGHDQLASVVVDHELQRLRMAYEAEKMLCKENESKLIIHTTTYDAILKQKEHKIETLQQQNDRVQRENEDAEAKIILIHKQLQECQDNYIKEISELQHR